MNYTGKLYGRIGSRYVPLVRTSEEVDRMETLLADLPKELDMLRKSNPSKDWKAAIDAVMNILPRP